MLALSKVINRVLLTNILTATIELLKKYKKSYYGENKSKIKQGTLCNDYKSLDWKVYVYSQKLLAYKCSWMLLKIMWWKFSSLEINTFVSDWDALW